MAEMAEVLPEDHFEKFIVNEIFSGKYGSASEIVKTALGMLESEEQGKTTALPKVKPDIFFNCSTFKIGYSQSAVRFAIIAHGIK